MFIPLLYMLSLLETRFSYKINESGGWVVEDALCFPRGALNLGK